jgi:hypothetical protein
MSDDQRIMDLAWKEDWATARQHHIDWWSGKGLVLWVTAPRETPADEVPPPPPPQSLEERWFSPQWRLKQQEYGLAHTYFGGDSFPMFSCVSAAGDLGAYVGCEVNLAENTVWCDPCIPDPPEAFPAISLNREAQAFRKHMDMLRLAVRESRGRWLVTLPDLVENIDILSAMRGPQTLMFDMMDRPEWVEQKVLEINRAYFEAFDAFRNIVRDAHDGNCFCFNIWGPGRTAKVQCDACAMFGPQMFRRFVAPALTEQCAWLDYALYHLDGEDCLVNLDELLAIEPLQAVEWTPRRLSVGDSGGHPRHWDLYRRILAGGKAVQAVGVRFDEVLPLLDACGGHGMYIMTRAPSEEQARKLAERVEQYR